MKKMFTLSEVQTMLPVLESLLLRAQETGGRAAALGSSLDDLRQQIFLAGGMHVDVGTVARERAEQGVAIEETKATVAEIEAIGARVHDLADGLLDLPYRTDAGDVMLCWRLGEPTVTHWHGTEEEPAERRPLDERFGQSERDRLN